MPTFYVERLRTRQEYVVITQEADTAEEAKQIVTAQASPPDEQWTTDANGIHMWTDRVAENEQDLGYT